MFVVEGRGRDVKEGKGGEMMNVVLLRLCHFSVSPIASMSSLSTNVLLLCMCVMVVCDACVCLCV